MKALKIILYIILVPIYIFETLTEILAIPALFTVIGVLNSFGWKYYVITIGGYLIVAVIIQIVFHFVFKRSEERFFERLKRRFPNIFDDHAQNTQ